MTSSTLSSAPRARRNTMNAAIEKEARPACKPRARHAKTGNESLPDDWERGTLWAGIIFAVSFGLMFLWAGVAF